MPYLDVSCLACFAASLGVLCTSVRLAYLSQNSADSGHADNYLVRRRFTFFWSIIWTKTTQFTTACPFSKSNLINMFSRAELNKGSNKANGRIERIFSIVSLNFIIFSDSLPRLPFPFSHVLRLPGAFREPTLNGSLTNKPLAARATRIRKTKVWVACTTRMPWSTTLK